MRYGFLRGRAYVAKCVGVRASLEAFARGANSEIESKVVAIGVQGRWPGIVCPGI